MFRSKIRVLKILSFVMIFFLFSRLSFYEQGPDIGSLWNSYREEQKLKKIIDKAVDDIVSDHLAMFASNSFVAPEDLDSIFHVQSYLACLVHNARWDFDDTLGGANVSLVLPKNCKISSSQDLSLSFSDELCPALSGKRILLVGSETTYHLHELWLRMLERRHNESHDCPGREFCTFHHICRDKAVYPPQEHENVGRKKKIPTNNVLRATRSAVLQYTFTTTLYAGSNHRDAIYQRPKIDPGSGIRQVSQYWLRRARKADIVFLNLAPLPAPASTYTRLPSGDWEFATTACHRQQQYFPSDACKRSLSYGLASVALDMTLHKFLPSVLSACAKVVIDRKSLTVWQGNWFIQTSCARKGLPSGVPSLNDFWSSTNLSNRKMDPWSYLYNLQVYLQDRILSQILPLYGGFYLPLTLPVLDRSIYAPSPDTRNEMHTVKDCIKAPWPSFSDDLGRAYFTTVSALMALSNT